MFFLKGAIEHMEVVFKNRYFSDLIQYIYTLIRIFDELLFLASLSNLIRIASQVLSFGKHYPRRPPDIGILFLSSLSFSGRKCNVFKVGN